MKAPAQFNAFKAARQAEKAARITNLLDRIAVERKIDPLLNAQAVIDAILANIDAVGRAWLATKCGLKSVPSDETMALVRQGYADRARIAETVAPSNLYSLRPGSVERVSR